MLKRLVVMFLGLFLLSGCTDGFRDYHKRSANNKLIDRKGFQGGKHPPLYNKKYVKMAKKNVMEENFDDDDELLSEYDTETINPVLRNRQMYLQMVKQDAGRVKKQKINGSNDSSDTLNSARAKINKENIAKDEAKIAKELEQIKLMLNETKKNLERYKCSIPQNDTKVKTDIIDDKISSHKLPITNSIPKALKDSSTKSKMNKKFLSEDFDCNNISTDNNAEEEINPRAL